MWMNEWDVNDTAEQFSKEETPNLHAGAMALWRLMNWTNSHSDGWAFWPKPSKASESLQGALRKAYDEYRQGGDPTDITDAELAKLLRPIKAFLTRQGANHEDVFPTPPTDEEVEWAAWHELLHEAASQMAADALNNGEGKAFLMMNGWDEQTIDEHLARRIKERS